MPNNKKKKGGKGNKGDRAAVLARRAERKIGIHSLPLFGPVRETYEEEMKRVIGYKHLSIKSDSDHKDSDKPVSITLKDNGKVATQLLTEDVGFAVKPKKGQGPQNSFLPDYDRNAADYRVARQIIGLPRVDDLTRRVKKCVDDVPAGKMNAAFLKFMERGQCVHVKCDKCDTVPLGLYGTKPLSGLIYRCKVTLLGGEYEGDGVQSFLLFVSKMGHAFAFSGYFSTCLQKYQKELALLLAHECMTRVSAGTAELDDELDEETTPDKLVDAISNALREMYTTKKRWTDLAGLSMFLLDRAIEKKSSLTKTTAIECELGEALEACGFHKQAALVYAEAGKYLHLAEHPKTATLMSNAGLAWKRHGDYGNAESYYALALQSLLRFEHDQIEYRNLVFSILINLFILYMDPVKNVASLKLLLTLRALLLAAGEKLPEDGGIIHSSEDDAPPILRGAFQNPTVEQAHRIIQYIISKTTSVESLREAILSCANPGSRHIELYSSSDRQERTKDHAREYLRGNYESAGYLARCSACGNVKEEKSFEICSCHDAYYCDVSCQKAHWPQHKTECSVARKAVKKKKNESAK